MLLNYRLGMVPQLIMADVGDANSEAVIVHDLFNNIVWNGANSRYLYSLIADLAYFFHRFCQVSFGLSELAYRIQLGSKRRWFQVSAPW